MILKRKQNIYTRKGHISTENPTVKHCLLFVVDWKVALLENWEEGDCHSHVYNQSFIPSLGHESDNEKEKSNTTIRWLLTSWKWRTRTDDEDNVDSILLVPSPTTWVIEQLATQTQLWDEGAYAEIKTACLSHDWLPWNQLSKMDS